MSLCTHDIDALRHARHVQIQEADGAAAVLALGSLRTLLAYLATSLVPFVKTVKLQHAVNAHTSTALGASPARGGTVYYHSIQRADRAKWNAFAECLQEGDDIRIQWEREGKALLLVLLRNGQAVHEATFARARRLPRPWRRSTQNADAPVTSPR